MCAVLLAELTGCIGQSVARDSKKDDTFKEGKYEMKHYWMASPEKGSHGDHSSVAAARIHQAIP